MAALARHDPRRCTNDDSRSSKASGPSHHEIQNLLDEAGVSAETGRTPAATAAAATPATPTPLSIHRRVMGPCPVGGVSVGSVLFIDDVLVSNIGLINAEMRPTQPVNDGLTTVPSTMIASIRLTIPLPVSAM